jgi:hypothetical protein
MLPRLLLPLSFPQSEALNDGMYTKKAPPGESYMWEERKWTKITWDKIGHGENSQANGWYQQQSIISTKLMPSTLVSSNRYPDIGHYLLTNNQSCFGCYNIIIIDINITNPLEMTHPTVSTHTRRIRVEISSRRSIPIDVCVVLISEALYRMVHGGNVWLFVDDNNNPYCFVFVLPCWWPRDTSFGQSGCSYSKHDIFNYNIQLCCICCMLLKQASSSDERDLLMTTSNDETRSSVSFFLVEAPIFFFRAWWWWCVQTTRRSSLRVDGQTVGDDIDARSGRTRLSPREEEKNSRKAERRLTHSLNCVLVVVVVDHNKKLLAVNNNNVVLRRPGRILQYN